MRVERFLIFLFLIAVQDYCRCQQLLSLTPKNPIVCYAKPVDQHTTVNPPIEYLRSTRSPNARVETPIFEVTYTGFTPQAQAAFQKAVDIWSSLLTSSQKIHVTAVWQPLGPGVLGSAIWGSVYANFKGAQFVNTYYPVALAEKIASHDLNSASDPDIYANFSSTMNWDYGLTGNPASGKYDLVTVVLHELGHGLGFVDSYTVDSSNGTVGVQGSGIPMIYDLSLENTSGVNLYQGFSSPSPALKTQLTTNGIFYNSSQVLASNAGNRAKIYAPSTFSSGSSISHVDEFTYPSGDINSLMSPQIGSMESIHDPGPIVKAAFSDMGWVNTFIEHTKLPNTENTAGPYIVKAKLVSEAGPIGQANLFYSSGATTDTKVTMTPTGIPNEYMAQIPSVGVGNTYRYYISVNDNLARNFTNPGKIVSPGKTRQQGYNVFVTGTDHQNPRITHSPKTFILNTATSLKIEAIIADNIGVEQATVEYKIDDIDQAPVSMTVHPPDSLYAATINLGAGLNIGDKIKYKIVAVDSSSNHNTKTSPDTDYFEVNVTGLKPTQDFYVNNFNSQSSDFFGDGFNIATPAGFSNGAIHSEHPYLEGSGFPNNERNTTYELLVPIKLKSHDATIRFNEIALVEPGDAGAKFGDANFFDYVIVEGSKDGGATWTPVADGYNSTENTAWLTRFNSSFSGNNSTGIGDSSLYRPRTLNLLSKFRIGDEIVIRFRLYSDPFTAGWGWVIDDLKIQIDDTPPTVLNDYADFLMPGATSLPISINATDAGGVRDLLVEYQLNSTPLQSHSFAVVPNISEYTLNLNVSNFSPGDTIKYNIIATDSSNNQGTFPPVGFISTYIFKPSDAIGQYVNNFDTSSNDFIGNFFSVDKPPGFANASINSNHFYHNGMGLNLTSSYSFILTKPIIINIDNPYMQYDEIVIVEGHNSGVSFGSAAFNDYVIIEGSIDNGNSWKSIIDGYDAADQSIWNDSFKNGKNGTLSMYKQRTINLIEKSGFKAGNAVLIRFRLFANELNNGWGWSIDNLSIQGPVTEIENVQSDLKFHLYPNPAKNAINVQVDTENDRKLKMTVSGVLGNIFLSRDFVATENLFHEEINLSNLPAGVYIVKIETARKIYSKKFVKE